MQVHSPITSLVSAVEELREDLVYADVAVMMKYLQDVALPEDAE